MTHECEQIEMQTTTTYQPKERNLTTSPLLVSKWSNRFIWAAILQGLVATLATVPIVLPWINPAVSKVIAGGGAGTWFTVGYLSYIVVGVIAVAVTALFYQHFEVTLGKPYSRLTNALAGIHLVLMNVGALAACALMMYGGYFAGAAIINGQTALWVHENILSQLVNPIGYAIIATGVGVLAGGLGFFINYFRR
jgi:hypothetical protein